MQCELLFGGTTTNPRKREECIDLLFVLANSRTTYSDFYPALTVNLVTLTIHHLEQ